MASSYRGLYRLGPVDSPTDIQVVDTGGNSLPLPNSVYMSRGVLPDWQQLPTQKQYAVLEAVAKFERGESAWINPADAEDCQKRGWIEPSSCPAWRLTEAGRSLLG